MDGKPYQFKAWPLDPASLDSLVTELLSRVQGPPLREEQVPPDIPAGYFAFLNIYAEVGSRQILLTLHDFKDPVDSQWETPGRIFTLFGW